MRLADYLRDIEWGESVLIEHTSLSAYPRVFHTIGEVYGWGRLLIVDVLDSSMSIIRWLRLSKVKIPGKIRRIKVGGTSDWGEVVLEVDPHKDPGIFLNRLSRSVREYYRENPKTVSILMNPEKLIPLHGNSPRFILSLSNLGYAFLGNPVRKTFYFVNVDLAERRYVAILEEAFIRVLRIDDSGSITVLKSPHADEEGLTLEL
ncbi:hypothetical protein APY94_04440 [Thermococcus celericrescens]|uniref:Uncharacterized protein n=1 Tax=Thermococcus celericrescens TaxID=227598 RepID=A0A124EBF4_9EURY|nr:DUF257 family protein [Thermococcus celericrescens]KUH33778.1 hypothetical protein APY94_04440 [Thermococcus celericrescens]